MPGIGTLVRDMLEDKVSEVFARPGSAAFDNSKGAAAIHDAGHVIVYMVQGVCVEHAHIEAHGSGWFGYTKGRDAAFLIKNDEGETAELYLHQARVLIAGVQAEEMFDPDFRCGSSLDEVVMSQVLAVRAAGLTGQRPSDQDRYWERMVWQPIGVVLHHYRQVHHEIGHHLFAHGSVSRAPLTRWTAEIRSRS
jgi:hypothetical protein